MSDYIIVHGIKVAQNFVPETFGRLTTIGPRFLLPVGTRNDRKPRQVCYCECGAVGIFFTERIRSGHTRSCGCLHREQLRNRLTTHGRTHSAEYRNWAGMLNRCNNPNAEKRLDYGGRGIRVCDRWLEPETGFINFLADMGVRPSPKHSIDRIDNDGNYCPENCRWATQKEQTRNQRTNRMLTFNGKSQCMADWADELQINKGTLKKRLNAGWSVEKSLTTPVRQQRRGVETNAT